jgi:DeoR/GlpR family transcriptional regulator of sugar metabolism
MTNRRNEIVALVNREGFVSLQRLREIFHDVSEVTLRKDLSYLDSTLQLVRVHGGAKSLPNAIGTIDNYYTRLAVNIESKKKIAEKAVKILQQNNSLYIASGTTCNEFVKALPDIRMQVFTDGVATALELAKFSNIETTMLGGELDNEMLRLQGPKVLSELSTLHFDYAFFSADGYRPEYGFICCTSYFASLLQAVRNHTDKLVIMLDSGKVNAIRAARVFPTKNVDIVIGDGNFNSATLKSFSQADVTVL